MSPQKELNSIDRQRTPWVIAMWHSPWYNSNKDHQGEFNTIDMRAAMEKMIVDGASARPSVSL